MENIRTNISLILFIRKVFFFLSFFLRNHAKERNRISFKKDRCKIFVLEKSMGHLLIKIIAFTSFRVYSKSLRKSDGILFPIDHWKNPSADLYNYFR